MKLKRRYAFWKICLGMILIGGTAHLLEQISNPFGETEAERVAAMANPDRRWARPLHQVVYLFMFLYFTINWFYTYIAANKKLLSFLKLVAIMFLVAAAYHTVLYFTFPIFLKRDYPSLHYMYGVMVFNMLPMLLVSFLFAYGTYLYESLKQRRILEAQKLQLETQISQANFNFLKAQINPHFLHNTLSFLYAKSLPYAPELSEGILILSDIMRYALSQGHQKEGKALLKDEIEHVHNVIRINQLRYNHQLNVAIDVQGELNGKLIIPFVLITLVENAFKHGDIRNHQHPITIKLNVKDNSLYFYCSNKKNTGPRELSTGIGLPNIEKRLELAYGSGYRFTVKNEADFYTTELTIDVL